jgi:hypothetical protein
LISRSVPCGAVRSTPGTEVECDARTGNGMSMADDNTVRSYRSSETHRRDSAVGVEAPSRSDPLAELARLIGQNDPFAEFAANAGRQPAEHQAATVVPSSPSEWRRSTPSSVARAEPPAADARPAPASPAYQRRDPHQMASGGERLAQPDFDESYESDQSADAFGLQPPHASPPVAADDAGDADAFLAQGEPMGQDDDELYDDAPASRRGGAGVVALTIIICAVVGSASAYGYRSYTMVARATQAPPIITAEKTPTKVIPANDAQSGKSIQDRVRDGGPAERVVSREEQPVELRNMISTVPPRPTP